MPEDNQQDSQSQQQEQQQLADNQHTEGDDSQHQDQDERGGNAEAAKWRRKTRAAEAERDALRERVDGHDRAEVESRAREELHDPADLFSVTSLEELRGDDGVLDAGKLDTVLETIKREKPHWMKTNPNQPLDLHQGARQDADPAGPSFGAALKRGGRR